MESVSGEKALRTKSWTNERTYSDSGVEARDLKGPGEIRRPIQGCDCNLAMTKWNKNHFTIEISAIALL